MASYLRDLGKLCKKVEKYCLGVWGGGLCSNMGGCRPLRWGEILGNAVEGSGVGRRALRWRRVGWNVT